MDYLYLYIYYKEYLRTCGDELDAALTIDEHLYIEYLSALSHLLIPETHMYFSSLFFKDRTDNID